MLIYFNKVILTKEEKERLVIKLARENKNYRTISKIAHVSFVDIGKIIRKFNGEPDYQNKNPSITSKAFQMFKDGKNRVDVAIALDLESFEVVRLFHDYLKLSSFDGLVVAYDYLRDNLPIFLDLFVKMRDEGIVNQPAIARFVQAAGKLARLEEESFEICGQIGRLNDKKAEIKKDIEKASSLLSYLRDECSTLQ